MYKVRFHLARGENFMKWQVTQPNGDKRYLNPEHNSIAMCGCKLRVQPSTAQKIHDGANKSVCAWIDCHHLQETNDPIPMTIFDTRIAFNPKQSVHWMAEEGGTAVPLEVQAREFIPLIVTNGRELFIIPTYE